MFADSKHIEIEIRIGNNSLLDISEKEYKVLTYNLPKS